jgi:hypothetical protein
MGRGCWREVTLRAKYGVERLGGCFDSCLNSSLLRTYFDRTYSEAGTCRTIRLLLSSQNDISSPLSVHFSLTSHHESG